MACERLELPGGGVAIVCTRGKRTRSCSVCGRRGAELLCDGRSPGRKRTCDAPLCRRCARSAGAGVDHCPACAALVIARVPPTLAEDDGDLDPVPEYLTLVAGSTSLVSRPGGESWARQLVECIVDFAATLVTTDALGPAAWALDEARRCRRRDRLTAVYALDGSIRDLDGVGIGRWAKPAEVPGERAPHRKSWPMTRDSAMVRAVSVRAGQGRAVDVEVLHDPMEPPGLSSALVTVGFARTAKLNPHLHTFNEAPPAKGSE